MDLGIKGKRALVCASSKGMGQAIAQELAQEGAAIFMCARDNKELAAAADQIKNISAQAVHYQSCDLTNAQSCAQLVEAVNKQLGGVDILVHNVGGPKPTKADETSLDQWSAGFEQLFASVARLNQAFIPAMKQQRWGRIVTVTSLSVLEPIPNLAVSNAMRSATTAMLKTLADELARFNICINCVAPGVIHTDRTEERIHAQIKESGGSREQYLADYVKSIPAGRLGTSKEFAAAVVFLCSQRASYITGSTICVDGGKRRSTY